MTARRIVLCLAILAAFVVPSSAQQPLRSPDVIFVPTPQEVVDAMLKLAKVGANDVVYDLGSGDGRIPITAARTYGARGVGIDTNRISMFIFALGAFLAALGGVIGGAFLGIYPGLDFEMLPLAFAVVIIGGMGSLGGAAIGALAVGLADNFGKALFPEVSYFTLYAPMVLILAVKPTGLFGRE